MAQPSSSVSVETTRKLYSTTSSVYADNTISNQNNGQIQYCISTILQAEICSEAKLPPDERSSIFGDFNVVPDMPYEQGGMVDPTLIPEDVLNRECRGDLPLRAMILSNRVPTIESISMFMSNLKYRAQYPDECDIIALVYLNRLLRGSETQAPFPLSAVNWRAIWASCVIIAQKMFDDKPLKTSCFPLILTGFSKDLVRSLEMKAINLLHFTTSVKPSVYAKYYFELRTLFAAVQVNSPPELIDKEWTAKPLTLMQAQRLEDRRDCHWTQGSCHWDKVKSSDKKKKKGTITTTSSTMNKHDTNSNHTQRNKTTASDIDISLSEYRELDSSSRVLSSITRVSTSPPVLMEVSSEDEDVTTIAHTDNTDNISDASLTIAFTTTGKLVTTQPSSILHPAFPIGTKCMPVAHTQSVPTVSSTLVRSPASMGSISLSTKSTTLQGRDMTRSNSQLARQIRQDLESTSSLMCGLLGVSINDINRPTRSTYTYEDVTLVNTSRYVIS